MKETAFRNYLLVVLMSILAFNFVDRLALGLVMQDIKAEFALSDTQLGFLSGIAFALFYSVMGIPIARWADRGNRVVIISLTTALWSGGVFLCGLATNFVQLIAVRVGVAVGEAGCMPPAHSLIADHFSRAERPRAAARYMLGAPLSLVIGYFLAGWLNEFHGWRVTFMLLGVPGLMLALIAWFTLKEPRCQVATVSSRSTQGAEAFDDARASLRVVIGTLWNNVTFRHLVFSFAVGQFFAFGVLQWKPAFFIRSFGLTTGELGTWFAIVYGIGGLLGTYWGGEWASRHAANNERLQLRTLAIAYSSISVSSTLMYLSPSPYVAFALMALATLGSAVTNGPLLATIQSLVPQRMRAVAIAATYMFANFIGMGLGPLAAGALSDALRPVFGEESLRYALLAFCPGYVWVGWHLWQASKTVTRDLEAAHVVNDSTTRREEDDAVASA